MKLLETIKNALFEEEYVEVKPKTKKEEQKDSSFEQVKIEEKETKKDKPIAKKIILSRPKKEHSIDISKDIEDPIDISKTDPYYDIPKDKEDITTKQTKDVDYRVQSYENGYKEDNYYEMNASSNAYSKNPVVEDRVMYRDETPKEKHPYGIDESNKNLVQEYGKAYEKKDDRTGFKPSPIISPIYGVLDKNYKKEDVVQKNPKVSNYSKDSLKVDNVRNKAYGTKEVERKTEVKIMEKSNQQVVIKHHEEEEDDGNLLVDLSKDEVKPSIKEVTMGDAMEYFQDLGLEYNVDYVDASKEKATGRRVKENYGEEPELFAIENEELQARPIPKLDTKKEVIPKKNTSEIDVDNSDNLFDLIENMYQEEK